MESLELMFIIWFYGAIFTGLIISLCVYMAFNTYIPSNPRLDEILEFFSDPDSTVSLCIVLLLFVIVWPVLWACLIYDLNKGR